MLLKVLKSTISINCVIFPSFWRLSDSWNRFMMWQNFWKTTLVVMMCYYHQQVQTLSLFLSDFLYSFLSASELCILQRAWHGFNMYILQGRMPLMILRMWAIAIVPETWWINTLLERLMSQLSQRRPNIDPQNSLTIIRTGHLSSSSSSFNS